MKLSHLSLAILSAIALAACGGSGSDDHTTDPNANKPGATDQTPKQPEDKKDEDKKEDTAKEDAKIVDPTGDQVVDNISLAETSTTASQQYLRGKASQFDRIANPNQPASATVLSGITLDVQNPQLTNIVIGRIDDKNSKGERVQVAFYAGSESNQMNSVSSVPSVYRPLQTENALNALVGGLVKGVGSSSANSGFGLDNSAGKSYVAGSLRTIVNNNGIFDSGAAQNYEDAFRELIENGSAYQYWLNLYKERAAKYIADVKANPAAKFDNTDPDGNVAITVTTEYNKYRSNLLTAINSFNSAQDALVKDKKFKSLGIKLVKIDDLAVAQDLTTAFPKPEEPSESELKLFEKNTSDYSIPKAFSSASLEKYGAGLYWYVYDNAVVSGALNGAGWGDVIVPGKGVVGVEAGDATYPEASKPTTGLVGIYKNGGKWVVRGSEENNVRTTRIFGHYYLDPGSEDSLTLNPEGLNSWNSARTFITGLDAKGDPNQYGLGAAPITLNHVQYGRVTATIDDNDAAKYAGTSGWVKKHQDFANRDPKYANDADNFYFYRGTNATSIEDMAKLPTDATIAYQGHALMYGIDNRFHGGGQELPNAFGNQQSYGLGNFVKANLNMGSKKFDGYIYNVWGSPASAAVKEDKLVEFSGDVTGNTVVGTANLAYDTSKTGDLRASFYGAGAEEVGGAINSVKREDPYGPIGWGGVFGAQRTTSGNSAWLVSSEKK